MTDELVPDCVQCRLYFEENAHSLTVAITAYGVEPGPSTREVLAEHMAKLHKQHEAGRS